MKEPKKVVLICPDANDCTFDECCKHKYPHKAQDTTCCDIPCDFNEREHKPCVPYVEPKKEELQKCNSRATFLKLADIVYSGLHNNTMDIDLALDMLRGVLKNRFENSL